MTWRLHWLEASGDLGPWRSAVADAVEIPPKAAASVLPVPPLDILVQPVPGAAIPETGTTGQALRPGLFSLTIDPDNSDFAKALHDGDLRRTMAHEAHHCLRMAGPGYGWTRARPS